MHPADHSADAAYRRSLDMHDEEDFWDDDPEDEDDETEPLTEWQKQQLIQAINQKEIRVTILHTRQHAKNITNQIKAILDQKDHQ